MADHLSLPPFCEACGATDHLFPVDTDGDHPTWACRDRLGCRLRRRPLPSQGMARYRVMVVRETIYKATIEDESEAAAGARLLAQAQSAKPGDLSSEIEVSEQWHEPIAWATQPDSRE